MSCNNSCSSNTYNSSKIYQPTSVHCLNLYPIIPVATLYNYYQKCNDKCNDNCNDKCNDKCNKVSNIINKGNKIILNVVDLEQDEFFSMFYYTTAKYFCVNKANTSNRSIVLACQTYVANDSRIHKLSLYQEIIKSFEQNYNVSANNINPAALISLQREVYNTQSLACICGSQLGLSWDQVIANLISNDSIERGSENSVAIIIFQVNLNYHSCALNVDLTITFQYKVPIFGYILKNVAPPYSMAEDVFSSNHREEYNSPPKYNIQSLANKIRDIEELILDTNEMDFNFNNNNRHVTFNSETEDND